MSRPSKKNGHPGPENLSDFHDILMNAPIGVFTSTPDGRYISVNHATNKDRDRPCTFIPRAYIHGFMVDSILIGYSSTAGQHDEWQYFRGKPARPGNKRACGSALQDT